MITAHWENKPTKGGNVYSVVSIDKHTNAHFYKFAWFRFEFPVDKTTFLDYLSMLIDLRHDLDDIRYFPHSARLCV